MRSSSFFFSHKKRAVCAPFSVPSFFFVCKALIFSFAYNTCVPSAHRYGFLFFNKNLLQNYYFYLLFCKGALLQMVTLCLCLVLATQYSYRVKGREGMDKHPWLSIIFSITIMRDAFLFHVFSMHGMVNFFMGFCYGSNFFLR